MKRLIKLLKVIQGLRVVTGENLHIRVEFDETVKIVENTEEIEKTLCEFDTPHDAIAYILTIYPTLKRLEA